MEGKNLTKGNLLKNMTRLLIPLVLTNLLNSIYNIVDGMLLDFPICCYQLGNYYKDLY